MDRVWRAVIFVRQHTPSATLETLSLSPSTKSARNPALDVSVCSGREREGEGERREKVREREGERRDSDRESVCKCRFDLAVCILLL